MLLKDRLFPTDALYKECKLLKVKDMHEFVTLQFVHKSVHSTATTPENIREFYTRNMNTHDVNVRDIFLVRIPKTNNAIGEQTVHRFGAALWNKLPLHLRSLSDREVFKSNLKDYMLSKYRMT